MPVSAKFTETCIGNPMDTYPPQTLTCLPYKHKRKVFQVIYIYKTQIRMN